MGVIVPASILLPIFFALVRWKSLTLERKILFWYLIMSGIINLAATLIGKYWHQNNMPLVHILTVLEVLILLRFYKKLLSHRKKNNLYFGIALFFITLCIVNALFFQSIYTYCSYTRSLAAILLMVFAMNYFAKVAAESEDIKIITFPEFYFNTGIFLYYSGAFILFIFSNFTLINIKSKDDFLIIWCFHASLIFLMNILFSIGFFYEFSNR